MHAEAATTRDPRRMESARALCGAALALLWAAPGCARAATPPGDEAVPRCESDEVARVPAGAVYGQVRIDNHDVFDLDDPRENRRLYRLANRLHIQTRPAVIRARLLFAPGDPYTVQELHESERLLRAAKYLYDARICVLAVHDGVVDVSVETRDVWTLRPGISFGRSGGKNKSGISVEDENLLGLGMSVSLERKHDVDRDSNVFIFRDPNLLGRWLTLDTSFTDSSDGRTLHLGLDEPFYALDVRRARGFSYTDDDRIDPLYERGEVVDEFRQRSSYQRGWWGWSPGLQDGWTRRWTVGFVHDAERFSPSDEPGATTLLPQDRVLQYPYFGFELLRDHFITARNNNQMSRTEDFYLGPRYYGELGLLTEGLGSDRSGIVYSGLWSYGFQSTHRTKWLASVQTSGRAERGEGLVDALASARFELYHRHSERRLLFATVQGDVAHDLDVDHQLLIGGDSGLRGYPLRYQGGDRRALLTVEERYFTKWYPFRLFHVAGAAFFDVGRAWGSNPFARDDLGWLKDIGIGARFGGSRSGTGTMIHVDVAMPLDGASSIDKLQFVVETKQGF
jgi:hypothetical protein